jgi:hypothetical protein
MVTLATLIIKKSALVTIADTWPDLIHDERIHVVVWEDSAFNMQIAIEQIREDQKKEKDGKG